MSPASAPTKPTFTALLKAGVAHQQGGRLAEAEAAYKQALKVTPGQPDALHLLGALASGAGRPELAVEMIGKAISAVPNHAPFHHTLGQVLIANGKPMEAAGSFRRVIQINPDHNEACKREIMLVAERAAGPAGLTETSITHLVARAGYPVHLVPGEPDNIKLTYPEDWQAALDRLAGE